MVISAYKEQKSIRDIMKVFSIPWTTIEYKILTNNNVHFQVYKKILSEDKMAIKIRLENVDCNINGECLASQMEMAK